MKDNLKFALYLMSIAVPAVGITAAICWISEQIGNRHGPEAELVSMMVICTLLTAIFCVVEIATDSVRQARRRP